MTDDLTHRAEGLSPEKLALLVLRMKKKRAAEGASAPKSGGLSRRQATGPAPASFGQQRLWLLDRLEPDGTAYNMPSPIRLRGALAVSAMESALAEIVRRHESLRTTFVEHDGEARQIVGAPTSFRLPVIDLAGMPEAWLRAEETRLLEKEKRPYDLETGPLFRVALARLAADEHVLLLDMHHIISDGWSFGVFYKELSALYGAFVKGKPSPLPELPVQYTDFAAWQREWLQGPVLEEQLGYWRERLADAPPALEMPFDRLRPAVQAHRGDSVQLLLTPAQTSALRSLSLKEGTSMFMALLSVFKLLLSRLSGQDDVVVGSPSAGRSRVEVEGLIGLFLNTLVLRTRLDGAPSFRELLGRVKEVVLGAYRYQALPFERLLEELHPERQLSRTPIFQVLFNYVSLSDLQLKLEGLQVEGARLSQPDSKFDFTIYVHEAEESLHLNLVYNADLFHRERMVEMQRQLAFLVEQVVADPDAAVGSYSLVTPHAAGLLPDPTLPLSGAWRGAGHQALSRHAALQPGKVAVRDALGAVWTYAELDSRTNRLARLLIDRGVEKGDVVAVWAHRRAALVEALLGTLKAGAAFLILDPAYPVPRLLDLLRIGRPTGWIGVPGAPELPEEIARIAESCRCRFELPETGVEGFPETDPGVEVGPGDAACITFTSGSTGVPKGVVGVHGSLTHFYPFMGERFGLDGDDRHGMLSALSHDPLQRDLLTPIWFGAELVVPDHEGVHTPGYLAAWARNERLTVLNLTPAMMELLLESAESAVDSLGGPVRELPDLRRAFVVGDQLKKTDVERMYGLAPSLQCVNLYGSTETQRAISFFEVPRNLDPEHLSKEVLPLGRGFDGVQLLVINGAGRLAGVGELGEIHTRSRNLARGYLGDDTLTADRFRPNPFVAVPEPGDRTYRTGDLGRYLPGGGVEHCGRTDFQVKLRGFRIELGEVEAALSRYPGVRECVAVVREDVPGRKLLAAYLVMAEGPEGPTVPEPRDLRAFLTDRLPDYMVPSVFVALPALPLTRTGKVDRKALPAAQDSGRDAEPAAPRNEVETSLAEVWAEVLRRETVGIHDNFFELGGDSIRTIQVVSRSRKRGLLLTPRQIFQHQTIAELAEVVERERPAGGASAGTVVPMTPAQRWRRKAGPWREGGREVVRVEVPAGMGEDALRTSLAALAARHDALRLRFDADGQRLGEPSIALEPLPSGGRLEGGLEGGSEALRAAFRPGGAGEPGVLILAAHPLAVDEPSWNVLLADLASLPALAPEPVVPFSRWAEALASGGGEHDPAPGEISVGPVSSNLSEGDTASLLGPALKAYGNSIEELLLVATAQALGSPRTAIRVEEIRPERDDLTSFRTVGCLASPVEVNLESRSGPVDALKEGKERLRRALREPVGGDRQESDVVLRWRAPLSMPSPWRAERMEAAPGKSRARALRVDCSLDGGRLRADWSSGGAHRKEDVERIADRFLERLGSLIRHCLSAEAGGFTPSDFPVSGLDQADLDQLLAELG